MADFDMRNKTLLPLPGIYSGVASVYGEPQKVTCGGRLNVNALTVAHPRANEGPLWRCGQRLKVTYKDRSIIVTINDHGPHIKNRVLDMTPEVAKRLKFPGLGKITYERI